MPRLLSLIVGGILALVLIAPVAAQAIAPDARAAFAGFMDARMDRNPAAALAWVTDDLRARNPSGFVGASNPCAYRYAVLTFQSTSPTTVAAQVRIYQHFWPGDNAGGPPRSQQEEITISQTAAGWRISRVGQPHDERAEPNEPHGPTTSACTVGRRPGEWLTAPGQLPATGAGGAATEPALPVVALGLGLLVVTGLVLYRRWRDDQRMMAGCCSPRRRTP